MKRNVISTRLTVRFFIVLLLALAAIQFSGGISYAAPAPVAPPPQATVSPQPFICTNPIAANKYCNVRVALLIDDTGSMRSNDPTNIRNQGAKNLVDILLQEYYQPAVDAQTAGSNVAPPDIEVAVIHFSHCVSTSPIFNCGTDVKFNSGWRPITQSEQIYKDIDWLATQPDYYKVKQYTHFIEPFQAAEALFNQPTAKNGNDCTRQFILLLTDGTPEDTQGPLIGETLDDELKQVQSDAAGFLAKPESKVYVTAFKIAKHYWDSAEPYWNDLAGKENVTLENSLDAVASRMAQIVTSTIGAQSATLSPQADNSRLYKLDVIAHTASVRVTYFKLDPNASLTLTDPSGAEVVPDDETVIRTGQGTSIEVWTLNNPASGTYDILSSARGGIITTTPRFDMNAQLTAPTADAPLLQFTSGLIRFDLVDSQGKPILPTDFPTGYTLSLTSELIQGDASTSLNLTQDGASYQTNWLPLSTDAGNVTVSVELTNADQVSVLSCQGSVGTFAVDAAKVNVTAPSACTEVNTPVSVPLQVVNARTGQNAGLDLPIQWKSDSVTYPSGQKVTSSVKEVESQAGTFQLQLTPLLYETVKSHLIATVTTDKGDSPLFEGDVAISVCPQKEIPEPECKLSDFWKFVLWIIILLLAGIVLFRLLLGDPDKKYIIPTWLLVVLILILLLLLYFWCRTIPYWPLLLLLLLLLLIFLLIRLITHDRNWTGSFWFWLYLLLFILLIVIWLIYYSQYWIYLLLVLLVLFLLLLIIWLISDRNREKEPFSFWWLLILLILLVSLWMILRGSFSFWLILILLLILLLFLYLLWLLVEVEESRSSQRFWSILILLLILILLWIIFFSAYWIYLLWLIVILLLIWLILWLLYRFHNPLWGVIGIVDEEGQLIWFASLGKREDSNSSYDWKFEKPFCVVKRLRLRSWDRPSHHLTILVERIGGKHRFIRSLDEWQDCVLDGGCRIVWMEEIPSQPEGYPVPPKPEEPSKPVTPPVYPVPSEPSEPSEPPRPGPGGSYPIEKIEGIGKVYGKKFRGIGIPTTDDLLVAGRTPAGRRELAKRIDVSTKLILEWVNRADLMRVPGIGEEYSDLLEASGVDTVKELRHRTPENLHPELCKVNQAKRLVRHDPSLEEVRAWVKAAQAMEAAIEY